MSSVYDNGGIIGKYLIPGSSSRSGIWNYLETYFTPPSGQAEFTTPGTYVWTAPPSVFSVSVVAFGGGGGGHMGSTRSFGGGGGGLGWTNNIAVIPGNSYEVVVGAGGSRATSFSTTVNTATGGGASYFIDVATAAGFGGAGGFYNTDSSAKASGGNFSGDGGGSGGDSLYPGPYASGGGGAGGYSGKGGDSGFDSEGDGADGTGGGGGGGGNCGSRDSAGGGGGVGIYGEGASGIGGAGSGGNSYGGEGGSGGAIALASSSKVIMLENSIYSVISPEGCATILWRDPKRMLDAAKAMKLSAKDLLKLKVIDEIIPEPLGGAHRDKNMILSSVRESISKNLIIFQEMSAEEIIDQRKNKFLKIGRSKGFISNLENLSTLGDKRNNMEQFINKNKKNIFYGTSFLFLVTILVIFLL